MYLITLYSCIQMIARFTCRLRFALHFSKQIQTLLPILCHYRHFARWRVISKIDSTDALLFTLSMIISLHIQMKSPPAGVSIYNKSLVGIALHGQWPSQMYRNIASRRHLESNTSPASQLRDSKFPGKSHAIQSRSFDCTAPDWVKVSRRLSWCRICDDPDPHLWNRWTTEHALLFRDSWMLAYTSDEVTFRKASTCLATGFR
jgi:hypothetical protein